MNRQKMTTAIGISAVAMLVGSAGAQTITWDTSATTASWNNASNWVGGVVPGASNNVVIPSGGQQPQFDVSSATIAALDVQGGTLSFAANTSLTVTGAVNIEKDGLINVNGTSAKMILSGVDALDIDDSTGGTNPGLLQLNASGAELRLTADSSTTGHQLDGPIEIRDSQAFMAVNNNMIFKGSSKVEGFDDGAQVKIALNKRLTSRVDFVGQMEILGLGSPSLAGIFDNEDIVQATVNGGTIKINSRIEDGAASDKWRVDSGAVLQFSRGSASLVGAFVVSGDLDIDADVTTSGALTCNTAGKIVVAANRQFTYDSSTSIPDPVDPVNETTHNCP